MNSDIQFASHAMTASQHSMATSQSISGNYAVTVASGERPLWEVGVIPPQRSLGDVAREYRKAHDGAEKSAPNRVYEGQGESR